jgi:hypothetical protein
MADRINPLEDSKIRADKENVDNEEDGVYQNYLHYFSNKGFWEGR